MEEFTSRLEIIGVNPFVHIPKDILQQIFLKAGKNKGPIPVYGVMNDKPYKQTLVKFNGIWRLYVNTKMLKNSPKRIGEIVHINIDYDAIKREFIIHPILKNALENNKEAYEVFNRLAQSRRLEIVRYIAKLKTQESIEKNVKRAIQFLLGKERFIGRTKP